MSGAPTIKRFIAGAVCPACSAMDTIDTLDERGNSVPREVPTRVTKAKPVEPSKAQTVQFFPNPRLKKK